jgi:hypothetical protein
VDVGTGIRFVGPDEPIRHLGVLLGSDVEACRAALYDTLAARLERRVASWATASLSLFGRAYVARQCMASIFTYHATFVPPPPTFLTRAADLFATFVQMGVRADPGRIGGKLYPNRAVSALPWEQGGMRFPDVHGIVIALQSSVISRLLRPQQAAWKLMLIQWLGRPSTWVQDHPDVPARDIDCWGLGVRALFCTPELPLHTLPDAALIGGVPARVLSYIRAFRRLLPHRDTPATTFAAIMAEPLFFNTAVCNEVGRPLGGPQWRHCAASGVRRVGDLRRLYRAPPGTAPPHQVEALLQALPLAWRALVLQPEEPIPEWAAWGGHPGRFLRRLDPVSPGTCMMLQVYRMLIQGGGASGRLTATGDFLPPAEVCHARLLPAIVDTWDGTRGGRVDPTLRTFVFAGGHTWPCDPRPWMVGTTPVLTLSASVAAQRWRDVRLWQVDSRRGDSRHFAHLPMRPTIWEDDWGPDAAPVQGLRASEQRHLHAVGGRAAVGRPVVLRRPRDEGDAADPPWLDLQRPPAARLSLADRIAARPPPDPVRRVPPRAVGLGSTDVLAPPPGARPPPWRHVWTAVARSGLSYVERACAFRILHGCVFTGVFKAYIHMAAPPGDRFCHHPTCGEPTFDTLSHTFLSCPLAHQVWVWVGDLWASLTGARFPVSVAVLLADDRRAWQPPPDAAELWLRLRLLTLAALWKAHCRRGHGVPTPLVTVIAGFVSRVRAIMASDAALVCDDGPRFATVGGDTVRTPLPAFTRAAFLARWGLRDLLCSWPAASARPALRFTLVHPAPVPREEDPG